MEATLSHLKSLNPAPYETIVADGNSLDETCRIAENHGVEVVKSLQLGRAAQMHEAALSAQGDILCFLHADTFPPKNLVNVVNETLADESVVLAGFRSIMKGNKTQHITSFHNRIKTYYAPFIYNPYRTLFKGLRLLFGDQLMFCSKENYIKSGGFDPEVMIMEEADLCLKMNKLGRIIQLKEKVESSDRRVAKWGVLKANFIFISIASLWALRVPSQKLAKYYDHIR